MFPVGVFPIGVFPPNVFAPGGETIIPPISIEEAEIEALIWAKVSDEPETVNTGEAQIPMILLLLHEHLN